MSGEAKRDDQRAALGERVVFWSWAGGIAVGLAVMIILPLAGR